MKASVLLLCLLLLMLSACGGEDDDLNADGDPLGGDGIGVTVDEDDASAVIPDDGATGDDLFGSDTDGNGATTLAEGDDAGSLFGEETGADATGD